MHAKEGCWAQERERIGRGNEHNPAPKARTRTPRRLPGAILVAAWAHSCVLRLRPHRGPEFRAILVNVVGVPFACRRHRAAAHSTRACTHTPGGGEGGEHVYKMSDGDAAPTARHALRGGQGPRAGGVWQARQQVIRDPAADGGPTLQISLCGRVAPPCNPLRTEAHGGFAAIIRRPSASAVVRHGCAVALHAPRCSVRCFASGAPPRRPANAAAAATPLPPLLKPFRLSTTTVRAWRRALAAAAALSS